MTWMAGHAHQNSTKHRVALGSGVICFNADWRVYHIYTVYLTRCLSFWCKFPNRVDLTMAQSSAARTNLTSTSVVISSEVLGEGAFRIAYEGTFVGGNRNSQEAACKRFKDKYRVLENEFFSHDFQIADHAIQYAEEWNQFCVSGKEILVSRGTIFTKDGRKYLVEPLIRYFTKFTSNNGWIANEEDEGWSVLAMEAFSHFTYHRSGGQLIVCDIQGRYRYDKYSQKRCRFELTDPAICSRRRTFGPTDMGEKGIESFFANHVCNNFCHADGGKWQRPRDSVQWFPKSSQTSMLASRHAHLLRLNNRTTFNSGFTILLEEEDSDY